MTALSYREYRPPDDLARWIACFWQIKGGVAQGSAFAHRVLPDGCADLLSRGVRGIGPTSRRLRDSADQSHLVRDFQAFVGLSPTRWAATQAPDAGFFQDGQLTAL